MAISTALESQLEQKIERLIATGRYNSPAEVMQEGIRLVEEQEARLTNLDASLARGIADGDCGRVKLAAEVFDRLETKYRTIADAKIQ